MHIMKCVCGFCFFWFRSCEWKMEIADDESTNYNHGDNDDDEHEEYKRTNRVEIFYGPWMKQYSNPPSTRTVDKCGERINMAPNRPIIMHLYVCVCIRMFTGHTDVVNNR